MALDVEDELRVERGGPAEEVDPAEDANRTVSIDCMSEILRTAVKAYRDTAFANVTASSLLNMIVAGT